MPHLSLGELICFETRAEFAGALRAYQSRVGFAAGTGLAQDDPYAVAAAADAAAAAAAAAVRLAVACGGLELGHTGTAASTAPQTCLGHCQCQHQHQAEPLLTDAGTDPGVVTVAGIGAVPGTVPCLGFGVEAGGMRGTAEGNLTEESQKAVACMCLEWWGHNWDGDAGTEKGLWMIACHSFVAGAVVADLQNKKLIGQ